MSDDTGNLVCTAQVTAGAEHLRRPYSSGSRFFSLRATARMADWYLGSPRCRAVSPGPFGTNFSDADASLTGSAVRRRWIASTSQVQGQVAKTRRSAGWADRIITGQSLGYRAGDRFQCPGPAAISEPQRDRSSTSCPLVASRQAACCVRRSAGVKSRSPLTDSARTAPCRSTAAVSDCPPSFSAPVRTQAASYRPATTWSGGSPAVRSRGRGSGGGLRQTLRRPWRRRREVRRLAAGHGHVEARPADLVLLIDPGSARVADVDSHARP